MIDFPPLAAASVGARAVLFGSHNSVQAVPLSSAAASRVENVSRSIFPLSSLSVTLTLAPTSPYLDLILYTHLSHLTPQLPLARLRWTFGIGALRSSVFMSSGFSSVVSFCSRQHQFAPRPSNSCQTVHQRKLKHRERRQERYDRYDLQNMNTTRLLENSTLILLHSPSSDQDEPLLSAQVNGFVPPAA